MKRLFLPVLLLLLLMGSLAIPAHAQGSVQVVSDQATLSFPETIQFSAEFKSASKITSGILEYGVDELTCGTVAARAFPDFTEGTDVTLQWSWEMRQSGSLPPGATVWWHWLITTENGTQFTSPKQTIVWLDSLYSWQTITGGNINLHYYNENADFGNQLHDAAVSALNRLSNDIGLTTEKPVDIYIYANTDDLKNSVLYAPQWVGGQAFAENNIVIIAVSPDILDWGKSTEAHELTHVLVGHLTFSCLNFMPTWLSEGLAMYGEGGLTSNEQAQFDQAKQANQLISLRSLIGQFSEESTRAYLSYSEAYSVVNFMVKTYGQAKMIDFLKALRDGQAVDAAMQSVYGFNTDGLEAAWRQSIGLPVAQSQGEATPVPTPTLIPTIVPIGAVPVAPAQVSTPHPTESPAPGTPAAEGNAAPATEPPAQATKNPLIPGNIATILEIGGACVVVGLLLVGVPIFFAVRHTHRRAR